MFEMEWGHQVLDFKKEPRAEWSRKQPIHRDVRDKTSKVPWEGAGDAEGVRALRAWEGTGQVSLQREKLSAWLVTFRGGHWKGQG